LTARIQERAPKDLAYKQNESIIKTGVNMSATPLDIINLYKAHRQNLAGRTDLQQTLIKAEFWRQMPLVQWEVNVSDVRAYGIYRLEGWIVYRKSWLSRRQVVLIEADINGASPEKLASLNKGMQVRLVGAPSQIDTNDYGIHGDKDYVKAKIQFKSAQIL
jgi:hypothetical protein